MKRGKIIKMSEKTQKVAVLVFKQHEIYGDELEFIYRYLSK